MYWYRSSWEEQSPKALRLGIPQSIGVAANLQVVQDSMHKGVPQTRFPPPSSVLCCNTQLRALTWPPSSWRNPFQKNIASHHRRPLSRVEKPLYVELIEVLAPLLSAFIILDKSFKPPLSLRFLICKMELMMYTLPTF